MIKISMNLTVIRIRKVTRRAGDAYQRGFDRFRYVGRSD